MSGSASTSSPFAAVQDTPQLMNTRSISSQTHTDPDTTRPTAPGSTLKRAAGLLTSTGKPADGLQRSISSNEALTNNQDRCQDTGRGVRRRTVNMGQSIRRKLKRVSAVLTRRSLSASYSSNQPNDTGVQSEGQVLPEFLTSHSPAAKQSARNSQNSPLPTPKSPFICPTELPQPSFETNPPCNTAATLSSPKVSGARSPSYTAAIGDPFVDDPYLVTPTFKDSVSTESLVDFKVPQLLQQGTPLLKISKKRQKPNQFVFRLDANLSRIVWESKVPKYIAVENIKEIRTGQAARNHILQLECTPEEDYLPRWITIIYRGPPSRSKPNLSPLPLGSPKSNYSAHTHKTIHLVSSSPLVIQLWEHTLRAMVALRISLTSGLGFGGGMNSDRTMEAIRQALWERSFWTIAGENMRSVNPKSGSNADWVLVDDESPIDQDEQRLSFTEMRALCERLNVRMSEAEVARLFKLADVYEQGSLDFKAFRRFGKLLKARPELERLFKNSIQDPHHEDTGIVRDDSLHRRTSCNNSPVGMSFSEFETFMRSKQQSELTVVELKDIFDRYSVEVADPSSDDNESLFPYSDQTLNISLSSLPTPPASNSSSSSLNVRDWGADAPRVAHSALFATSEPSMTRVMTQETFTSFLLSSDNPACLERKSHSGADLLIRSSHHNAQHTTTTYHRLSEISHDMTRPLSEYYISSSHNTYLIGHQLYGESTVEGYVRAFLGGCRSVELDIFDTDNGPQIFHGKTLTTKVSLREVCEAIMTYGFIASPYPLLISAEIHCGLVGQAQLVAIMKSVFQDRLVRRDETGTIVGITQTAQTSEHTLSLSEVILSSSTIEQLPSPEELKGRILVKAKKIHSSVDKDNQILVHSSSTSSGKDVLLESAFDVSASSPSDADPSFELRTRTRTPSRRRSSLGNITKDPDLLKRIRGRGKSDSSPPPSSYSPRRPKAMGSSASRHSSSDESSKGSSKTSPDLLSLLVYTVGVKYRGINKTEVYRPEEMFSLSEKMANKMLKVGMIDLIKHTRGHLVRIYPQGTRVNSTNYLPHRYWSTGAQLVAINWQTFDLGYMINHAMFQRNGGSGYLLKPSSLRMPHRGLLLKQTQHYLDLTIISAQHLPAPKDATGKDILTIPSVNPYVQVSVHIPEWPVPPPPPSASIITSRSESTFTTGAAAPGQNGLISPNSGFLSSNPRLVRSNSYCTQVVKNNGFNPVWEEKIRIPFTSVGDMEDLIFVRFAVRHSEKEDVEPLAQFCTSLGSIQRGYRHLPLHDSQMSQYLFSTLFVRIDIS
ncbi:hypothetical protein F5878DRAFT_568314 [Lentinula raphanica]|uniref:Phosphoinositide phospholipase C n=1 Tax=Lentinula raphanica TaxID=153919 RepID=A0AA38P1T3_9AGAR|nr:hypothetical protein F5878DRAFT_568314 [Lentinula raphanica]